MTIVEGALWALNNWTTIFGIGSSIVAAASALDAAIERPSDESEQTAYKAIMNVVKDVLAWIAINKGNATNKL
jgi:chaperonin GroEL (HSP60 family)